MHPFLLEELKFATELLGDGSSGHSGSNLAKLVHPSLCPILILLSRLKPSIIAIETGDELDPILFMPFIRRCSTQYNLRVRILASRAITGLVSNEKLPTILLNIASELPCIDNQVTTPSESSISYNKTKWSHHASFNWIHGILLQLSSLLYANCRNLVDQSKKDQILSNLIEVLSMCSWIARPKHCPCPILNATFLKVLDHMLSIARGCHIRSFNAIQDLVLKLSTECLDVEASYGRSYYDPTIAELHQQASTSYFSCVFQASDEVAEEAFHMPQQCSPLDSKKFKMPEMDKTFAGLEERLVYSLSDSAYEVRLSTLKWLFKFLKSTKSGLESHDLYSSEVGTIQHWTRTSLQTTLLKLLDLEKHHRCSYYILRIIFTWNLLQFQNAGDDKCTETIYVGRMDCDSVYLLWDKLISLYELTRHAKTREAVICCMGVCVKRFTGLFASSVLFDLEKRRLTEQSKSDEVKDLSRLYDRILFFTNLIKEHSASSEPVNMRNAVAESIIASGLLEQAELVGSSVFTSQIPLENPCSLFEPKEAINLYARQILDIWFTCIMLLEDEDDGVRQRVAMDVQRCFTCKSTGRSSHAGEVPIQVEKVIRLCFEYLSSLFGHWIEYFDYLLQWILKAANCEVSKGDLVRQVFDKEIDNHHEEKLLISQICCSHLEKLAILKSWPTKLLDEQHFRSYLHEWRLRFFHKLKAFSKDHIDKLGSVYWVGGVGNHKDAFLPLYANLLGFYALSCCIFNRKTEDGKALLSDVVELGRTINPYLRNPLVLNLYLLVVRSHEKIIGATVAHFIPGSREDDTIWDGFDPYFLLR